MIIKNTGEKEHLRERMHLNEPNKLHSQHVFESTRKIKPNVKARDWLLSQTVNAKLTLKSLKKTLKVTM